MFDLGLEGEWDVAVKAGPARLEGESDEDYLLRIKREEITQIKVEAEATDGTRRDSAQRRG